MGRLLDDLALAEICIQYRSDFHDQCIQTIQDLLAALPEDVTVRVVTESPDEFNFLKSRLSQSGRPLPARMKSVVTGMPITPWAKDRFGTMTAGGGPVLAVPRARTAAAGPRGNDEKVAALLCRRIPGVTHKVLPFMFDGGDLLSDSGNVYVAANMLARNGPLTDAGRRELLGAIASTFGKKVVCIGEDAEAVPDHHIGMYLTPLGSGKLAVADPDLGLRICRTLGVTQVAGVALETDSARYQPFRNVIRILQEQDLEFARVPIVLTLLPRVYATYNNAIIEERDGVKRIFMPVYDVPELDRQAAAVFEAQGFDVVSVRVGNLFRHTGSLRCLVGIIRRTAKRHDAADGRTWLHARLTSL